MNRQSSQIAQSSASNQNVPVGPLSPLGLRDGLTRSLDLSDKLGVHAIVVDAIDEQAKAFYERYGFVPLTDQPLSLYLPVATIRKSSNPG